uniref:ATPase subunit 6 n=1 Tax=Haslea provincialis TaxID=1764367 RepID=UPI00220AB607|nr:ATPase subunit 6 [Haslea provincialis]UXN44249.1 ATPase subunit 6 [Haslea provincialis]
MLIFSPLEQFQILPFYTFIYHNFDFSLTNAALINLIGFFGFWALLYFASSNKNCFNSPSFFFIPGPWQTVIESIYDMLSQLVFDLITVGSEKYFPFLTIIFSFILFSNVIGLIPYSFTITSHLIITFTLSFSIFIGLNIISYERHGIHMFSLFLPANTTFFLALLLVPIEFISYIAKPISLGVRLFINLMAGHSLLKVIVGFAWSMLLFENVQAISFLIPLFILVLLMGLELAVALIQTYVFITLTCIYINEAEVLH